MKTALTVVVSALVQALSCAGERHRRGRGVVFAFPVSGGAIGAGWLSCAAAGVPVFLFVRRSARGGATRSRVFQWPAGRVIMAA